MRSEHGHFGLTETMPDTVFVMFPLSVASISFSLSNNGRQFWLLVSFSFDSTRCVSP